MGAGGPVRRRGDERPAEAERVDNRPHVGDRSPDRTQRLLNRASWDTFAAMGAVRRFAVDGLDQAAIRSGHRRPGGCVVMALPLDLEFRTKGQLAVDVLASAFADGVSLDFACGDEVYGSCTELREYLEDRAQAYVLRVPSSSPLAPAPGVAATCAGAVRRLEGRLRWEVRCAGTGSKGQRWYAWAQFGLASPRHCLLMRRHQRTGELAYHYATCPRASRRGWPG